MRVGSGRPRGRVVVIGAVVLCIGIAVLVVWLVAGSPAGARPSSGVTGTVLAQGGSAGAIRAVSPGATDVVVRRIVIEPGGSTGWHYHSGELVGVVRTGTLTRQFEDCSTETNPAGQAIVEPAGRDHLHIGRNLGTEPVELYVTYLLPAGDPLAVDAPGPAC